MNEDKIFVGSGKDFHFNNGGQSLSLTINVDELAQAYKTYGFEYEGKRYIKLKAVTKREPDQHGKTHYVEVDTYNPNQQGKQGGQQQGQGGHNAYGSTQRQGRPGGGYQGPPPNAGNEFRDNRGNQSYDPKQNSRGYEGYQPPSAPAGGDYEDDIPF